MIYDVSAVIKYSYETSAADGRHIVRLLPSDKAAGQRLIAGRVSIVPAPDERTDRFDFFGNRTTDFSFRQTCHEVVLTLQARVDRTQPPLSERTTSRLGDMPQDLAGCRSLQGDAPVHFIGPSTRIRRDDGMTAYARSVTEADMRVPEAVMAIGSALHRDMRFDPDATSVDTTASAAFAARRGVCQDFSHIMITCLRGIGIPAGYVSGFLRTYPPPGRPRLEGADAMHAWVSAWCGPDVGWMEYDPTNGMAAGADHVKAGSGRDYFDVAPVKGVMTSSGHHTSTMSVDVIPVATKH